MAPDNTNTNQHDDAEAAGFSPEIDLDNVPAGSLFQAKWSFKNTGTTTWNSRYRLVYSLVPHDETANFDRSPLGAQTARDIGDIGVSGNVPPGSTVQLTLAFTAPPEPGTYATNWQLQSPDGQRFGPIRWLRVVVAQAAPAVAGANLAYEVDNFKNSVGDFNNMRAGQKFAGTWTLRNTGASGWSGDVQVVYMDQATADTGDLTRNRMGARLVSTLRDLTGREQVNPGETVDVRLNLVAPAQPGPYAFHWALRDENGTAFGGLRWLSIGVAGSVGTVSEPPAHPKDGTQFGMNVNINPPGNHPPDEERLAGLGWVRFVYWASREKKSPEEAYQQRYRGIIQRYANRGIRSLIILHQDTYWGNGPWKSGGWDEYAQNFGRECGRVAAVCSEFGDMVAYQIYNEVDSGWGDDFKNKNDSAIGIEPEHYAPILDQASRAIRTNHPGAKVIIGGLKTGPGNAVNYLKEVQRNLDGQLPIYALAYHPYGRYVKLKLFNFGDIGPLDDSLDLFKRTFPKFPLWITELGVASDSHIGSEHYAKIATYIREVVDEVAGNYSDLVPVLIWFGWTDLMRNAGINTVDDKPKPHVYDAFEAMKNRGISVAKSVSLLDMVDKATFVSYNSTLKDLNAVPAGSQFTSRWTFENSGGTTWGPGYKLVYAPEGDNPTAMVNQTSFELGDVADKTSVEPDDQVTITLDMTAPDTSGRTYHSHWHLQDPKGETFGFLFEELTVVPAPTAGTGVHKAGMTFVADHTIPDNSRLVAGRDFDKQWRVKNSGSRHWGTGFRLVFIQGDLQMARGIASHMVSPSKPGEIVTLTVPMIAPPALNGQPTTYGSLWRLQDDRGFVFGDQIWAKIVSTSAVSDTPSDDKPLTRLLNDPSIWYSQLDLRWRADRLGNGQATISSWGCLMTCMAMALSAHGTPITPPELNQKAIARGDFVGSAIQFHAPFSVGALKYKGNVASWPNSGVPHAEWTGEDPIQRIDNALAEGNIVLAQVDTKPNNGLFDSDNEQHWVIIVKRTPDGGDYLIIDPLTPPSNISAQPRSLINKYGNPAPSSSNETNLRNAIKSTLVYHQSGGAGN